MKKKNHAATRRPEQSFAGGRIEIKSTGTGAAAADGTFSGYAAIFNGVPHPTSSWSLPMDWNDVFAPGAFTKTLAEHKKAGTMPALLWQHDMRDPIGAWRSMTEDKTGLAVEGVLALDVENGGRAYSLLKIGGLRGISVGQRVTKAELDEETKTRTIIEVDLGEASLVTIQAVPGALVNDVKALADGEDGELTIGLQGVIGTAEDMAEDCIECKAGEDCLHTSIIEQCQSMVDLVQGESKSARRIDPKNVRDIEAVLRDAGLTRSEAKRLLADGFRPLAPRDADAELAAAIHRLSKTISTAA